MQFLYQALQDASSDNQMLLADENPSTISGRSSNAPQFSRCSSTALEDCAESSGRVENRGGLFGWTGNHPEKGFSQIWLQLIEQSVEAVFFFFFFFPIFSCCSKSGDQPQEDLAKSGYKTNREIENLGILLHVGETLERNMAITKGEN